MTRRNVFKRGLIQTLQLRRRTRGTATPGICSDPRTVLLHQSERLTGIPVLAKNLHWAPSVSDLHTTRYAWTSVTRRQAPRFSVLCAQFGHNQDIAPALSLLGTTSLLLAKTLLGLVVRLRLFAEPVETDGQPHHCADLLEATLEGLTGRRIVCLTDLRTAMVSTLPHALFTTTTATRDFCGFLSLIHRAFTLQCLVYVSQLSKGSACILAGWKSHTFAFGTVGSL